MSWINNEWMDVIYNGLRRASSVADDPYRVTEANVDDYTLYKPIRREECIVLYKLEENESIKLDMVFQTPLNHSTKKLFRLYRTTDEMEAQAIFCNMCEKLPILVECFPELGINKTGLQAVSQAVRDHPTWTSAHIIAFFGCLKPNHLENPKLEKILSHINSVCSNTLETPLHIAVKAGHLPTVTALMTLDPRLDIVDIEGNSVFHVAANTTKEILQALTVKPVLPIINLKNRKGCTALHIACMEEKPECVKELLKAGADVNLVCEIDEQDSTTMRDDNDEPPSRSIKEVLDTFCNQFSFCEVKSGGTPLHWSKTPELMEALLEFGVNVDAKNFAGQTALHMMVKHNRLSCAVMLLSHMANVDMQCSEGNTPLHLAVKSSDISLIHILIAFGANINLVNYKGETPRHILATEKNTGYGEMLFALHTVGAERCQKGTYGCNEGCIASGQFNGIPPEFTPVPLRSELFEDMLNEATNHASNKKRQKCHCGPSASGDRVKKCRVLTLDGGGIRGMVLIQLLYELEKVVGVPIVQCFDWVAGTSTGGILALVLATGKSIKVTRCLYFQLKDKVFVGSRPYGSEALETILKRELGDSTVMTDITFPRVMLTATTGDRKPAEFHVFRNYPSPLNILGHEETDPLRNNAPMPSPAEQLIWKAARATGAAPTYFRASEQYLDGGLISNNPTLDCLTEIHQCNKAWLATGKDDEVVDMSCVVSLGTGKCPIVPMDTLDVFRPDSFWGACRMALGVTALGQLLVDQATQTDGQVICRAHSWCDMLGIPFYRINPQLSENIALNETDNRILAKMLWETTAYMYSIRDKLEQLAEIIRP